MSAETPGPPAGEAGWLADPTGRHQLRWWDGRAWSAEVADAGMRSVDPAPVTVPAWAPSNQASGGTGQATAGQPPAGRRRRARTLVAAIAIAAVVVVLVTVATGALDEPDRFGTFEGEVATDRLGRHGVSLGAGQVLLATVTPDRDVDVAIGLLVDDDAADHLDDLFDAVADATDPDEAFPAAEPAAVDALTGDLDDPAIVLRTDLGFAGEAEVLLVVTARDLEGAVVVAPFGDPDAGGYTVEITGFALDLSADELAEADGEALLDAVLAHPDVPARAAEVARDLIELLEEQAAADG